MINSPGTEPRELMTILGQLKRSEEVGGTERSNCNQTNAKSVVSFVLWLCAWLYTYWSTAEQNGFSLCHTAQGGLKEELS